MAKTPYKTHSFHRSGICAESVRVARGAALPELLISQCAVPNRSTTVGTTAKDPRHGYCRRFKPKVVLIRNGYHLLYIID